MSLILATKLKLGIKFGKNYKAVSLTIHDHAIDGYEMLYNLISHLQPRLMRNKAINHTTIKVSKPNFDGNIHAFAQSYYS